MHNERADVVAAHLRTNLVRSLNFSADASSVISMPEYFLGMAIVVVATIVLQWPELWIGHIHQPWKI